MSIETIPKNMRGLRACLVCSLIKSLQQFVDDGCDNCEKFLHLKGDNERTIDCTSPCFNGMIAAMDPNDSWVCKWKNISRKHRGIYAVSTSGTLPPRIAAELRDMGVRYTARMRDATQ
ncbi:unnamed protein product, partial [Mesorhabditis belari]|uniref:Transcription elongation factor SPT4 n=1 Tax=Mesorhabditis belari TaxID=2138241 RepID=A0AAF3FEP1_9BILA